MPTTLRNTDILFNDSTTQSTAATAASLVTTTNVLNATAGATAGAVGTYAFATRISGNANVAFGGTLAGSNLGPVSASRFLSAGGPYSFPAGSALAGTWRAMGTYTYATSGCTIAFGATLWLRIS
jgi:hypothetical protein